LITSTQRKNKVLDQIRALTERIDAPAKPGVPPHMVVVSQAQLGDCIAALSTEIEEFDAAGTADIADLQFNTIAEMFKLPFKLRLATGQTIPQFARSINISTSTLKRYEAAEYASAPAEVLKTILTTYGLKVSGHTSRAA